MNATKVAGDGGIAAIGALMTRFTKVAIDALAVLDSVASRASLGWNGYGTPVRSVHPTA